MSLEDFLKKYYRQVHFNAMEPEVFARLQELIKKDSLTDKMRNWVRDYMHVDANGNYVKNDPPNTQNTTDLPDDVVQELFLACKHAFVGMAGGRAAFKDSDPQSRDFLDKYFGPGKLFNVSKATDDCERGIKVITDTIKRHPEIRRWLLRQTYINEKGESKKIFDNDVKLKEFLEKCDHQEYNTKGNVQDKVKKVADALERANEQDLTNTPLAPLMEIRTHISNVNDPKAFEIDPDNIPAAQRRSFDDKIREFRADIHEPEGILQTLYKNKTIRSRFGKYDDGVITSVIESKAEDEIDYQKKDSENYIKPKIEDELTPLQQLEKWAGDTYNDTLKKYEELRGGHLFFGKQAQEICKAIDKVSGKEKDPNNKITPANGLEKLLSRSEDVKKKLDADPVARQHFTWFVETMNGVKDDIPKAIEGCWKNAKQMKCVIEKIILKATDPQNDDPHAMEKAKTAMEVMTVMKYGMLTSKVMDAMRKEEFSMFSDGKLSWNKNEGIQFVTKAFDKSVKAAFLGVGYGITFARNKIMMRNMEFTNANNQNGALGNRMNQERQRLSSLQNSAQAQLTAAQNEQTTKQNAVNTLNANGLTEQTVKGHGGLEEQKAQIEQVLEQHRQNRDAASAKMETASQNRDAAQKIITQNEGAFNRGKELDDIIHDRDIDAKVNQLQTKMQENNAEITRINNILNAPQLLDEQGNPITDKRAQGAYKRKLYEDLGNLYNANRQLTNNINQENANRNNDARHNQANAELQGIQTQIDAYNHAQTDFQDAEAEYNTAEQEYNNADAAYNNHVQATNYDDISQKIQEFNTATAELDEINATVAEKQQALQNMTQDQKNKVVELENFWNFLQSGKVKTWRLFTSRAQAKFNANQAYQDYISERGSLAA